MVGNIHVLFNPNRGDIKLGQVLNALPPLPLYEETKSIAQFEDYTSSHVFSMHQDGVTFFISHWELFGMPVISSVKTRTVIISIIGSLTHDILTCIYRSMI